MNAWLEAAEQVGRALLGNPDSAAQLWLALAAGALTLLFVLSKAGSAFGIPNTGLWYSLVVGIVAVVLIVAAMVAAKLYLPLWDNASLRIWILVGAGLIVSLALVVPLICVFQKTGYFTALFAWLVSVGAAALIIAVVGGVFNTIVSGTRSAERGREHRKQVESLFD